MFHQRLLPALILTAFISPWSTTSFARSLPAEVAIQTSADDETTRAIALYQQGSNDEAIKALRSVVDRRANVIAWHYLGLAFEKQPDLDEAKKAHEKAARLGDQLLNTVIEQSQRFNNFSQVLRSVATEVAAAADSAHRYLQLSEKPSRAKRLEWEQRTASLLALVDAANSEEAAGTIYKSSDVDVKAKIISRPVPSYTEEARQAQVRGRIVVAAILAANGRVVGVRPLNSLPGGLTAEAIRCTLQIKFTPATKDGTPVSTSVQVEYDFLVY